MSVNIVQLVLDYKRYFTALNGLVGGVLTAIVHGWCGPVPGGGAQ